MESGAIGIIQPVARIKRKEFDLRAIREIRGFVNDESPRFDRGLDGHGGSVPLERAPNKALRNASVEPTTSMSIGSLRRFANMSGSAIRGRSARARKTASLNGLHLSQPSLRAERVKAAAPPERGRAQREP